MISNQSDEGYQEQKDDNSVPELGELRKTKLTLKQISKLRKMYDMRNYEKTEELKKDTSTVRTTSSTIVDLS